MIVVEGCDNSGKTTLALALASAMKLVFMKNCIRPTDRNEVLTWMQFIRSFQPNDRLITDRIPVISELVYGETLRGKSLVRQRETFITLLGINPTIIYCRPSLDNIRNLGERQQMNGVEENLENLVQAYDDLMTKLEEHLDLRVVRYDWASQTLKDLINEISQPQEDA